LLKLVDELAGNDEMAWKNIFNNKGKIDEKIISYKLYAQMLFEIFIKNAIS
jgi:hypothetical protein